MTKNVNFDNQPQPSSDLEKGSVARATMGLDESEHVRAPRFHRMSIAAAANGATVEHEHKPKPIKTSGDTNPSKSPAVADYAPSHAEPYLVHADHPVMKHIQAIHDHISKDCPGCHE